MTINGHTRTCGLIGNPVEHTSSPAIHNTLADIYGHNLVYVPFEVKKGQLDKAVEGALALNILGMNVTVPYKSDVIPLLADIDPLAAKIGAVNTLVRCQGGYKGYNTDILGLKRALETAGAQIKDRCTVILGAGGAARAAAFLCSDLGASHIYILNRSLDKAVSLADEIKKNSPEALVTPLILSDHDKISEESYNAIQCTSVGLSPNDDQVVIEDKSFYSKMDFGFDLVYRPAVTKFMKLAEESGAKTSNGLAMLLYQGIIAYELWNGISVDEKTAETVYKALEETVRS